METPAADPVAVAGTGADYPDWPQGEAFAGQGISEGAAPTPSAAEAPEGAPAPSAAPDALRAPPPQTDPATEARLAALQAERDHAAARAQAAEAGLQQWQLVVANAALADEQRRYADLDQRASQLDADEYRHERAVLDQRRQAREGIDAQRREAALAQREHAASEATQVAYATAIANATVAWVEQIGREHGLTEDEKRELLDSGMDPDRMPAFAQRLAGARANGSAQREAQAREATRADVIGGGGAQRLAPAQVDYGSLAYYDSIPWQRR